jgi:hypothetical protein
MTVSAIVFLTFFVVSVINMAIIFIHDIKRDNAFSDWRVVVEMTSGEGNRYLQTVRVKAFSCEAACALAMVQVRAVNHDYKLRALKAAQV